MTGITRTRPLREDLIEAGLLIPTSVHGLYLRSAEFEQLITGVGDLAHRSSAQANSDAGSEQEATVLFLPPVIPRTLFELTDYLRSFPNLTGSVDTFHGGDREHAELLRVADAGGDWAAGLSPAEVVLSPAACHALYPGLAGTLDVDGAAFEVEGYCFRHEPSLDPMRMQAFRMREFVHVGEPSRAVDHRDRWLNRGSDLLGGLGLDVTVVVANDPFFGRAGRILSVSQRHSELKYEIVTSIHAGERPTAIASANYHLDHFGRPFDIFTRDGNVAHSSCFGFGLERVALALLHTHGFEYHAWPREVRDQLWP